MARKLIKFLILFDNTSLVYFPGQFLTGRVLVELEEETPALGLHFHVVGEGVVRGGKQIHRESYIDFRMRLFGEPGQGPTPLSPGVHSFPFKLGLPLGLPSTFLGRHGWVQYYCAAALREPGGLTHKNRQVFLVVSPVDLRLEQERATPVRRESERPAGCGGARPLRANVSLDRGAYVPGESVAVSAHIVGAVKASRAALIETVEYRGGRIERRELARARRSGGSDWRAEPLYVPPLPPTDLRGCNLIRVRYDIEFVVEPLGCGRELVVRLPVTIGTYPADPDRPGTHYPSTLPVFRPWLDEKPT